jgi:predicted nucleic acid-binding protein
LSAVILDSGPIGLIAYAKVLPQAASCVRWLLSLMDAGIEIYIPEIADYEVRRELLRGGLSAGLARLDTLLVTSGVTYVPLTTAAMREAARLWAETRRRGTPTADPKALDGDAILAAQARLLGFDRDEFVVATTNVGHLSLFVPAAEWPAINATALRGR